MAGVKGRSGGHNRKPVEWHIAKGNYRPSKHGPRPTADVVPMARQPRAAEADDQVYASFMAWALATYTMTRAEQELVELAQGALDVARDPNVGPTVRLAAMGRFAGLLRDLNLPTEESFGATETPYPYLPGRGRVG